MQEDLEHFTHPDFWKLYKKLPIEIQELSDKNFQILKKTPSIRHCILKRSKIIGLYGLGFIIGHWLLKGALSLFGSGSVLMKNTIS